MFLNWGVEPLVSKLAHNSDDMVQNAMCATIDAGMIKISDKVIMVAGIYIISFVMVNTVRVVLVSNIVARGFQGGAVISMMTQERNSTGLPEWLSV